ncbi:MAG: glycosyl hydrolase family 18 protein [Flavobacteriales bacterium]
MHRMLATVVGASIAASSFAQTPALIGYYAGNGHNLAEHDIEQLTHLIWCFGHLEGDSLRLFPSAEEFPKAREKTITTMVAFKQRNPALKVLLSFGGWGGCPTCSEVFSREEGRRAFAVSTFHLLQRTHTDGIDLDWEYPAVPGPPGHGFADADRHNFTLLVRELRRTLGERYEISFAAGGTDECLLKGFEWDGVMSVVDRVHIMSYDLVHGYSTATGHHTPLYSCAHQALSADHAVHLLDSLGVKRHQIVIGAAFYARIWKDVPAQNAGLFQPGTFSHTIPYSAVDSTITGANGWDVFRDKGAWAAYAYNAGSKEFVTYDDAASIAAKANYVRHEGLGGIMFWQLIDDRPHTGLLNVMYNALRTP